MTASGTLREGNALKEITKQDMCANSQRWSKGEAYVSVWSKHFGASVKIMLVKTTVLFTHKKTTNKQNSKIMLVRITVLFTHKQEEKRKIMLAR